MIPSSTVILFLALAACTSSLKSDRVLDAFALDLLDSTNRPEGCHCSGSCPPLNGCPNRAFDGCGCCELCVRPPDSPCGPEMGVCDANLRCESNSESPESAVCKGKRTEVIDRCLHAKCNVTFAVTCPEDSRIHEPEGVEDSCCPKQLECKCYLEKCDRLIRHCPAGLDLVLVAEGKDVPGKCCGVFECRQKQVQCESAKCAEIGNDEPCPSDSFRPPSFTPKDGCCPISPDCKCRAAICDPVACDEDEVATVKKKGRGTPGRCCDEFVCSKRMTPLLSFESKKSVDANDGFQSHCNHSNKVYNDGDTWHPTNCRICECRKGIAACRDQHCPSVPKSCRWTEKLENDCCPVCRGCKSDDNTTHEISESWQKDKCTTCTCGEDGREHCQTSICVKTCANPRPVDGQCCDVCDEPTVIEASSTCPSLEHCPLRCENGLDFKDWCYICACKPSTPIFIGSDYDDCPKLNETNCNKVCAHGYMSDERGCKVCKCANCPHPDHCYKHCLYGFETNMIGCPVCKCRAKTIMDARLSNSKPDFNKCVSVDDRGHTVLRDSGEMWTDDRCRQCFCEDQVEYCTLISCPERPDSCPVQHWVKAKGDCCARCIDHNNRGIVVKHSQTVCHSPGTGRLFVDGETWQLDQCITCTCRVGQVLCSVKPCEPLICDNPISDDNNPCCKKCPSAEVAQVTYESNDSEATEYCTDEHGSGRAFGQKWWRDECTSCACERNSRVNCYTQKCPLLKKCVGKPLTVKGHCCPICSDRLTTNSMCSYGNATYRINEEWRENICTHCVCKAGGAVECIKTQCPSCDDRQPSDGPCCPLCNENASGMFFDGGHETEITVVTEPDSLNLTLWFVGVCICVLLLALAFLAFNIKRSFGTSFLKEAPPRDCSSILISKKCVGSSSRLNTAWKDPGRRGSVDGVSESLLSTVSDSSSAPSSNSSGIGPHSDTLPLTKSKSQPLGGRAKSSDSEHCRN